MPDRIPERFGRLAGERATRRVGDRAGNDHGPAPSDALEIRIEREQRGLGVQRIEDRLDKKKVGAAFGQRFDRLPVCV